MVYPRMPFGKYDGQRLDEIPASYLRWVLENCTNIDLALRRDIREVLEEFREEAEETKPTRTYQKPTPPATWNDVLRQWHREMVMRFHPDRGGSHEVMVALNIGYERLQS